MFGLTPVDVTITQPEVSLHSEGYATAVNMNVFGKRSFRQNDSGASNKIAKRMPDTPISSFRVARDVHESRSTLNIYASEAVNGMTASLFNDKSPYALQLGSEPVMREAVASLFELINNHVPKTSQIGNGGKR